MCFIFVAVAQVIEVLTGDGMDIGNKGRGFGASEEVETDEENSE